jgi:hypothetical protein
MSNQDYTATITVDRSTQEAFAAVTDVRGWWSQEIKGHSEEVGDVFLFEVPDVHRCTMTLTELVPGEKVVWRVSDSYLGFVEDQAEWDGTEVVFEVSEKDGGARVRFTHVGLAPAQECFDVCSNAWGSYITHSLRDLITTGQGDPYRAGGTFETEKLRHGFNDVRGA